jgi:hypothetical protein
MKITANYLTVLCATFSSSIVLTPFADAFVSTLYSSPRSFPSYLLSSKDSDHRTESLESIRKLLNEMKVELLNSAEGSFQKSLDTSKSKESVIRENILSTRLSNLQLNKTRIDVSTIPGAGRGLFASKDIAKGEVITCYPGDALLCSSDSEDDEVGEIESIDFQLNDLDLNSVVEYDEQADFDEEEEWGFDETIIWGSHVEEADRLDDTAVFQNNEFVIESSNPSLTHYALEVCDKYSIMGMPSLDSYPAYHGHFANDGAGHFATKKMDTDTDIEAEIAAYVNQSIRSSNAKHENVDGLHMVTVATENIKEGDEIFVTYGFDYWLEHST